jgi:hypothetical protein
MSIHAIKPETEAKIRQQRRASFITSSIIGFLSVFLLMLILSLVLMAPFFKETPTIVTYETNLSEDRELENKKIPVSMERKPSSPSSSMAKVIAAVTNSPTSVPVPDVDVMVPSVDFGDGNDFGDGWGNGDGFGTGGGGASFFNQKVQAERIAYVIDYSLSMGGERDKLMRKELVKSVSGLKTGMSYQLIFFAGPAWVAGDKVEMAGNKSAATIGSGARSYDWVSAGRSTHGWQTKGTKQKAGWLQSGPSLRNESLKLIKETPLVWGTTWEPALEMALAMDPPPQMIFFMTDGVTGGDTEALAKSIGAKAKAKKITLNTVAMMEPKAEKAMKILAQRTGGQFTIIEKSGKVRQVPIE